MAKAPARGFRDGHAHRAPLGGVEPIREHVPDHVVQGRDAVEGQPGTVDELHDAIRGQDLHAIRVGGKAREKGLLALR